MCDRLAERHPSVPDGSPYLPDADGFSQFLDLLALGGVHLGECRHGL